LALAQHPQICFSEPKETHYFIHAPEDLGQGRLEAEYFRAFFRADQMSRDTFGEASPSYLYSPPAIRAIDRLFPAARFLVMVRNPLEMLPSWHARALFTMDEDIANFEDAWRLQERRAKGRSIPAKCRDWRMLQYAEIGRLGARLSELIQIVGRDRVKAIVFDDFTSAPLAVYREVLDFLRIECDERTEIVRMNGTKAYRSPLVQRLLMRPPRVIRLIVPRTVGPSKPHVVGRLVKRLRKANVVRTHWQPISARMRQELVDCLRDDVDLLGRLLNRDLGHWLDVEPPSVIAPPRRRMAAAE